MNITIEINHQNGQCSLYEKQTPWFYSFTQYCKHLKEDYEDRNNKDIQSVYAISKGGRRIRIK